jgi:hypothetical protein
MRLPRSVTQVLAMSAKKIMTQKYGKALYIEFLFSSFFLKLKKKFFSILT